MNEILIGVVDVVTSAFCYICTCCVIVDFLDDCSCIVFVWVYHAYVSRTGNLNLNICLAFVFYASRNLVLLLSEPYARLLIVMEKIVVALSILESCDTSYVDMAGLFVVIFICDVYIFIINYF